ncbi:hypothetical protein FQA47_010909 [Oryzias melastigma]|uniref:Uncharacterized protein n=1 Tax=Oryzias melastigma TaxID=30732 RepID=A0A834F0S3_ORYME|nr:hypothetical protein FQA47_010909 [Oryzias melastigma]
MDKDRLIMCTRLVVQMSCHNMPVHASACALPMSALSPASCSSFGLIDAALFQRREAQGRRRADTVHSSLSHAAPAGDLFLPPRGMRIWIGEFPGDSCYASRRCAILSACSRPHRGI